jgi:hypothetical protein
MTACPSREKYVRHATKAAVPQRDIEAVDLQEAPRWASRVPEAPARTFRPTSRCVRPPEGAWPGVLASPDD